MQEVGNNEKGSSELKRKSIFLDGATRIGGGIRELVDMGRKGLSGGRRLEKVEKDRIALAIESMHEPAKKILSELRDDIDTGNYSTVLGDDASGRLPALLFHKILRTIYENKGLKAPRAFFVAGELRECVGEEVKRDFIDFIEKSGIKESSKGKKILIVTENITKGNHLSTFTEILKKMQINFDIVTMTISTITESRNGVFESLEAKLGGRIFWGGVNMNNLIKGRHDMAGVRKSYGEGPSLFAKPFPRPIEGSSSIGERFHMRNMIQIRRQARQDIGILAQKIVHWYRETGK